MGLIGHRLTRCHAPMRAWHPVRSRRWKRAVESINGFVLDVETGGLSPRLSDLFEVGMVGVHRGVVVSTHRWFVQRDPRKAFDDHCIELHSRRSVDVTWSAASVVKQVSAQIVFYNRLYGVRPRIIGHNVPFDLAFMNHAAHDNGLHDPFECQDLVSRRFLDTMVLAGAMQGMRGFESISL